VLFCQCHVVGWSPDSRSILFLDLVDRTSDDPVDVDLLRVWIDGGAVERVATIPDYDAGATVQPDGRTIAYRTGRWRGEIWALELSADPGRTADPVPEGRT
jgi:Tol biopolymer transport system component